ncbi:MAG TPA: hypothetical protein VJS37_03650 [Terriglobales bacterium]|nr:hypothetical protein [Terriglobales bacterium]
MKNTLWLVSILLRFVSAALAQTQSVPADVVAKLRKQAQMSYLHAQILHDEEYAAAVFSNGSVVYTMVSDRRGKFDLPLGTMLLLHTHLYGAQPEPGNADKETAKKILAPNCVVTANEVWCAMPKGKIVPGVLVANKPTAQAAAVEVQVYDLANLQPSTLQRFARSIQEILSATGISIDVVLCARTTAGSCETPGNREQLILRVAQGSAKKMNNLCYPPLGVSFADDSGGKYASIFLESIKGSAADANVPWPTVLDYAAVHEIGHLLLGSQAHTARGIMKARWDTNDFVAMYQGRLHFSVEQIRHLGSRYASNTQIEVASN